jgi:micrococcal nuclease
VRGASSADGIAARDFLRSLLPVGKRVTLVTYKDGKEKYGRYLADVYLAEPRVFNCVNDMMVTNGFARKME